MILNLTKDGALFGQFEWDQLDWDILYLWHGSPSTIGIKRLSSVFIIQQFDKAVR